MFNKFYQRISIFIALCVCFEVYKLTPALLVYCGYLCFRSGTCGAWDVTKALELGSACITQCKVLFNVKISPAGEKYRLIPYKIDELL